MTNIIKKQNGREKENRNYNNEDLKTLLYTTKNEMPIGNNEWSLVAELYKLIAHERKRAMRKNVSQKKV